MHSRFRIPPIEGVSRWFVVVALITLALNLAAIIVFTILLIYKL